MSLINLLSTGPGTFVYHLLIFLVLEALVGIAFIEYRRTRTLNHRRILRTFGGLMGIRVLLLLGEPLGPDVAAPIFNGTELASLTLLGAVFLTLFLNHSVGKKYLVSGLVATFLCTATFLPWWYRTLAQFPHLLYLTFWQQTFWYIVGALLVLAPTLILLRIQKGERPWLVVIAFGTLFLGFTTLGVGSLFLTMGWLDIPAYTLVGIGRLINMLGYPLFAVAVHQAALQDRPNRRQLQQHTSEEMPHQTANLQFLAKDRDGSLDVNSYLNRVAQGTATTLDADLCVIFLVNPDEPDTIHLAAQYSSYQNTGQTVWTLSLTDQPALAYALKRRQQLTLNVETNDPRLQAMYSALGNQETGPTVIQPILNLHRPLGALVVGNNHSQRVFEPDATRMCQNIAEQVASVLSK
jgi:hypothetical protein